MTRLTDVQVRLLGSAWGSIWAAHGEGLTVTDTVAAFAAAARDRGDSISMDQSRGISVLYGYASRLNHAAAAFGELGDNMTITADHIGIAPWSREQQVMNTDPIWHVTYDFTYTDTNGNLVTDKRTSIFEMTLPDTKAELIAALQDDAEALATKYNVDLAGIDPLSILAV